MKTTRILIVFAFLAGFITFQACQQASAPAESYKAEWLGESKQEMIDNIEEQLQGFSRTMRETGYRYQELFWAGADENWEYVLYQIEHIEEVLDQGFVRRPDYRNSARQFTDVALPALEKAAEDGDKAAFDRLFTQLTAACNTCHAMEEVPFMMVSQPKTRTSIISF